MYYLVFIYLVAQLILNKKVSRRNFFVVTLLLLSVISLIRYGVGADYFSYEMIYNDVNRLGLSVLTSNKVVDVEFGFKLLMLLSTFLNLNFQAFVGILGVIVTFLVLKWLYDESENFSLSVLLFYSIFYFVWVLSALRQGLVIALYLYLFHNNKIELNLKKKVTIIFMLSTLHTSALFLFLIEGLQLIKWNKKGHLVFFVLASAISVLPLATILSPLSGFPIVNRIYFYTSANEVNSIFSFPSIIRMLMFISIWLFYDNQSEYIKEMNMILYGFSFYFLFRFSEITASRLSVYTYFLVLLLIPYLVKRLSKIVNYRFVLILVSIGSTLYFYKETNTMILQSGMDLETKHVPFTTILNKSDYQFDNYFYFLKYRGEQLDNFYIKYVENFEETNMVFYSPTDQYHLVNFKKSGENLTMVVNQYGEWLLKPQYNPNLKLYGDVLLKVDDYGIFGSPRYMDITDEERTEEELENYVKEYLIEDFNLVNSIEEILEVTVTDIPQSMSHVFSYPDKIKSVSLSKITVPFEYHIMKVDYYYFHTPSYIYLDENMDTIVDIAFVSDKKFNQEGFLEASLPEFNLVIHRNGEIVWIESRE